MNTPAPKPLKAQDRFDEPITPTVLAEATERARQRKSPGLHATTLHYLPAFESLLIGFADQSAVALPVKNYPELVALSATELAQLTLGFGGSALCLDERDLHISIAGLVQASQPLMALASTVVAARNGSRSSHAKVQAARVNGLKGGRPRKLAAVG